MKIKVKQIETMINDFILLFIFLYLGVFSRYRMISSYILFFILILEIIISRNKIKVDKLRIIFLIFVLYVFFSAVFKNRKTGFQYILMLFNCFIILQMENDEKVYSKFINKAEIISLIFAIYTVINYFYRDITSIIFRFILSENQINNINKLLSNNLIPGLAGETSFNSFCIMIGLIATVSKILVTKKMNFKSIIKITIFLISIYLTGKRSSILISSIIIGVTIFIYFLTSMKLEIIEKFIMSIIIICVIPIIFKILKYNVLLKSSNSIDLSNRTWFWGLAISMYKSNPIFGCGINTFDFLYNVSKLGSGYIAYAGAHNSYIQILAELGILGLVIFLIYVLLNFIKSIKILSKSNCINIEASIIFSIFSQLFILIYAMTENPFYQPQQIIYYFYCLSIIKNMNIIIKDSK